MKKITLQNKRPHSSSSNHYLILLLASILLFVLPNTMNAQVRKAFTQRTAQATPLKTIYNIKGDFTMLGNTNLILKTYSDTDDNDKEVIYADVDGDPSTLNSSSAVLQLSTENGASPSCSNIIFAGLYWTGKSDDADTFTVTKGSVTKNYNKKVVSLKGPAASTYTQFTANTTDIWYPGAADDGIFVAYKEITAYVKLNGLGNYFVADIALKEGVGPTPGYSGGWGMVVIYENPKMNSREVTVFDGYANENGSFVGDIPISGFKAVLAGDVNMKLGVMASEGDRNRTGDFLQVQKLSSLTYIDLSHTLNTVDNFYNSSIFTGGNTRNPNKLNNTGIDLSMFTIPNAGNINIANGQTATNFKYGSTSDKFSIFGFAMSVDAYVPEPKGLISVNSINGIGVTYPLTVNALPGQSINYSLNVSNNGTEATNNTIISIPIPATAIFHTSPIVTHTYNGFTTPNLPYFDSVTNKIIWNLGTLPITAGQPELKYADISFTLDVTTDCSIILNAGCNPEVSLETATITGTGSISGVSFSKNFFQGYDSSACNLPIDGSIKVAISGGSCLTVMAGPNQIASCGGEYVTLSATSGTTGSWSIVSGPVGSGEIFSNSTSPSSTFYSPNIGLYTLKWTTTSCAANSDLVEVTFTLCNVVNFDGTDDNINFKNNFNLNSTNFSIEAWVKSNATNVNTQTILSKHISPSATNGYDLRLVNNLISFNWNGNSITATHPINTSRWYHIAVTFDGTNYKLYIDGILDNTSTGTNPTSNTVDCILGAMSQNTNTPYNYYNGYLDELRIWNVSLTVDQIRQMMNQEIINDAGNVKGIIIPKNIIGLSWTNLSGYYQMNRASDIVNGYLMDKSGSSKNGKLKGIYIQEPDTAPLPYTSGSDGNWETDAIWTNYSVWDVPNSFGIDGTTKINWNIVKTTHNIISNDNKTVLGLLINSNTLSAANDSKIEVSSYLKLDGKIDLVGKSQLVQTADSDLDVTSSGFIERDQQGQSNIYNYNYWCSPVSPINSIANNTNYTVNGVLRDGTNPASPANITWIGGYNGTPTSPISLARYWLFTFDNSVNAYAYWNPILETTPIRVGQGFTLKGSGATGTQNYTFVGKPNNGLIDSNIVGNDQLLLTGNPYPSALDAKAFIEDNVSSNTIDGNLYFWEHYTTNNTHILSDYQGGYATLNLVGGAPAGTAPTSAGLVPIISSLGSSTRGIPNQYIPVGQGFFVNGKIGGGGKVTFKNSQRGFHKEDELGVSNSMYKKRPGSKPTNLKSNSNDPIVKDTLMKIRLGFNSNNGFHRQVLLGFMNEKATSEIDYGYDGLNLDDFPNDMYLLNGENQLVIAGEGFFNENASYPIGVKTDNEGKVSIKIDALENFNPQQNIFIYDEETKTYNDIKNKPFEVSLPVGVNDTRFSLRFTNKTTSTENALSVVDQDFANDELIVLYSNNYKTLIIKNNILNSTVNTVNLYNILGQKISNWDIEDKAQTNIQIPIKNITSGIYVVKVKTSRGERSKKIIVN